MTTPSGASEPIGSIEQQLAAVLGDRRATLAENLVNFARLLKLAELDVTSGRVIDAGRALAAIDVGQMEDVRRALRANFITAEDQRALFDLLFDLYWRGGAGAPGALPPTKTLPAESEQPPGAQGRGRALISPTPSFRPWAENPAATANSHDLLTTKDFSAYTADEIVRGRRLLRQLAPKLATALSRRRRSARGRGAIDLRRSIRHSVKHGGEVVELLRQRRRRRKLRLVVLCDVSGSMDSYSRFLVQFLYALQNELRGVSTFVFSTRLNEVTRLLKTRSFDDALAQLSSGVDAWSGGTSIGASLYAFDRGYSRQRIDARTVIVIISDGWDRGDTTLLARAMRSFKRRSHTIVWLNPLLASPGYQPIARGMATALPFIDHFLPADSLESLARAGRALVRLAQD